jgi:hypothetical protein
VTADELTRIRSLADAILAQVCVAIDGGQLIVHYAGGQVQRVETHVIHAPTRPARKP